MSKRPLPHRPLKTWRRIEIEVPAGLSEIVAVFVAELSGRGVECVAAGAPGVGASEKIVGYLDDDPEREGREKRLQAFLAGLKEQFPAEPAATVSSRLVREEDWGREWKRHFKPARLTPRLVVKPSWEPYRAEGGEHVIEIDPGMAFGTGLHPSTRLALELIEQCWPSGEPGPARVLDAGTGTGILAMACALLGAREVLAVDNDPDAVAIAAENVRHNNLETIVRVSDDDVKTLPGPYDLIVANITSNILAALAPAFVNLLSADGRLILSGILKGDQQKSLTHTYATQGLNIIKTLTEDPWTALLASPPHPSPPSPSFRGRGQGEGARSR